MASSWSMQGRSPALQQSSPRSRRSRRSPFATSSTPDRYDHVGGNDVLSKAGNEFFPGTRAAGARPDAVRSVAAILAAEGVLRHMTVAGNQHRRARSLGFPRNPFATRRSFCIERRGDRGPAPAGRAHRQRCLRVLPAIGRRVAGDVLDTRRFPVIDIARGGSIDGEIAALNRLSESPWRRCPSCRAKRHDRDPGHGRLYDQFDVIEYRDMITIIRDRVRELVDADDRSNRSRPRARRRAMKGATATRGATGRRTSFSKSCTAVS